MLFSYEVLWTKNRERFLKFELQITVSLVSRINVIGPLCFASSFQLYLTFVYFFLFFFFLFALDCIRGSTNISFRIIITSSTKLSEETRDESNRLRLINRQRQLLESKRQRQQQVVATATRPPARYQLYLSFWLLFLLKQHTRHSLSSKLLLIRDIRL